MTGMTAWPQGHLTDLFTASFAPKPDGLFGCEIENRNSRTMTGHTLKRTQLVASRRVRQASQVRSTLESFRNAPPKAPVWRPLSLSVDPSESP